MAVDFTATFYLCKKQGKISKLTSFETGNTLAFSVRKFTNIAYYENLLRKL